MVLAWLPPLLIFIIVLLFGGLSMILKFVYEASNETARSLPTEDVETAQATQEAIQMQTVGLEEERSVTTT